jgi:hypothetical protein
MADAERIDEVIQGRARTETRLADQLEEACL